MNSKFKRFPSARLLSLLLSSLLGLLLAFAAALLPSQFSQASSAAAIDQAQLAGEVVTDTGSLPVLPMQVSGWTQVTPGIDYQRFILPGPVRIIVARMDRSNLGVTIDTSLARGKIDGAISTIANQAKLYDQSINYWGQWGNRSNVVVAINGSLYDISGSLMADSGVLHSGWFAKRFKPLETTAEFIWTLNRGAFVGECVAYLNSPELRQFVQFNPTGDPPGPVMRFDGINFPPKVSPDDQLLIYTPQFNLKTPESDEPIVEVLVQLATRPLLILPNTNDPENNKGIQGTVVTTATLGHGETIIPFDHIILSASGAATDTLLNNALPGTSVRIYQEVKPYLSSDCATSQPGIDFTKAYAGVGGDAIILKNGEIAIDPEDPDNAGYLKRDARTAVALNDDYIYFIVVDEFSVEYHYYESIGINLIDLGLFARDVLSATQAVNQDGGGSSTMWIDGRVMNYPSDQNINADCDYIPYFLPMLNSPAGIGRPASNPEVDPYLRWIGGSPTSCQRAVANGLLMVAVEPLTRSVALSPTLPVYAVEEMPILTGPGTNYLLIQEIPTGSQGVIMSHVLNMNGIFAKEEYWWKVQFGAVSGWAPQSYLTQSPEPLNPAALPAELRYTYD